MHGQAATHEVDVVIRVVEDKVLGPLGCPRALASHGVGWDGPPGSGKVHKRSGLLQVVLQGLLLLMPSAGMAVMLVLRSSLRGRVESLLSDRDQMLGVQTLDVSCHRLHPLGDGTCTTGRRSAKRQRFPSAEGSAKACHGWIMQAEERAPGQVGGWRRPGPHCLQTGPVTSSLRVAGDCVPPARRA